jgi:hypothetical protein
VPLGGRLDGLFGDFFVVCRNVASERPECFVLTPDEVRRLAHRGERNGKVSFWLQPKDYGHEKFREAWSRVGSGITGY